MLSTRLARRTRYVTALSTKTDPHRTCAASSRAP